MLPFIFLACFASFTAAQYNYDEVLEKSILFYEAQRSGVLPADNRIPWRGDSALGDGQDVGLDLTGGWYDAGDHVKFNFPMAYSTTVLAWSLWAFRGGYDVAGQLGLAQSQVRWALDYFVKCHPEDNTLYAQVGDGYEDHAYWGRPEQMTMNRPAMKIDTAAPGSDLAGETAAALAAGSLAFADDDPTYSATLLDHARRIYTFAYNNRGKYSDSINVGDFYGSSAYEDELAWGAIWLYHATGEQQYMDYALEFYSANVPWAFSWDDKNAGTQVLMYKATGDAQYSGHVTAFLNSWYPGGGLTYTPGGLAWRDTWGSLRYAASTCAIALLAAEEGIEAPDPDFGDSREWARDQIHYMLGDSGRSYVQGYGNNPPTRSHHRAASCDPNFDVECDWDQYNSPDPNPSVLNGALVGGPDQNDYYDDNRASYEFSEVTTDYNSGFQTSLAGLLQLGLKKQ